MTCEAMLCFAVSCFIFAIAVLILTFVYVIVKDMRE